jgi:hypothetical protein
MPFRKTTTLRASLAQQAMGFPFYSPRIAGKRFFCAANVGCLV